MQVARGGEILKQAEHKHQRLMQCGRRHQSRADTSILFKPKALGSNKRHVLNNLEYGRIMYKLS